MMGFLDEVRVMTCSFDNSRVGSVATTFGASLNDFFDRIYEGSFPAVRGKSPLDL
jgi:hypothetical protein